MCLLHDSPSTSLLDLNEGSRGTCCLAEALFKALALQLLQPPGISNLQHVAWVMQHCQHSWTIHFCINQVHGSKCDPPLHTGPTSAARRNMHESLHQLRSKPHKLPNRVMAISWWVYKTSTTQPAAGICLIAFCLLNYWVWIILLALQTKSNASPGLH